MATALSYLRNFRGEYISIVGNAAELQRRVGQKNMQDTALDKKLGKVKSFKAFVIFCRRVFRGYGNRACDGTFDESAWSDALGLLGKISQYFGGSVPRIQRTVGCAHYAFYGRFVGKDICGNMQNTN